MLTQDRSASRRPGDLKRSPYYYTACAALFVAGLVANLRLAGWSPIVWPDTFNDEFEVSQCLVHDSCTLRGVSTSVPGQAHAVAWLELRILLAWLGLGLDGVHFTMQVLNALAAVLVFHLATQLGGPLAGVTAAWIFVSRADVLVRVTALHNQSLVPFLGAVFVLACTAVVERPGIWSVALAALVGAVMANVHLACVVTGASVVWVALTAPRRRFLLAVFGAASFGLATFSIAPPNWLHNLMNLLQHPGGHPPGPGGMWENPLRGWLLLGVSTWLISFAGRAPAWAEYRRRSHGAIAVIVPFLAAFLVAPLFGLLAEPKYLLHLKPAGAIAAALALASAVRGVLRDPLRRRLIRLEWMLPFVLALVLALPGRLPLRASILAEDERVPTIADLTAVTRILHDEGGWDLARILEGLRTPYGVVFSGLPYLIAAEDGRKPAVAGLRSGAVLLMMEAHELPEPSPASWRVVRRSASAATVLVLPQSLIDWREFGLCVQPAGDPARRCEKTGLRFDGSERVFVPSMPLPGQGWRGVIEMSLSLLPAAPGLRQEIFMPRMPSVCGGQIISPPAPGLEASPDRRRAAISRAGVENGPSTVELRWQVGSPDCDTGAYDGLVPFFVEGDAATVRSIETILREREG